MDAFEALADPVRRALLRRLSRGRAARVVDLAAEQAVSRPAISRHLRVLHEAGLVTADDRGRERHYRIETAGLAPVRELLDELGGLPETAGLARTAGPGSPWPVSEHALAALDTEIRRTVRERRARRPPSSDRSEHEETA